MAHSETGHLTQDDHTFPPAGSRAEDRGLPGHPVLIGLHIAKATYAFREQLETLLRPLMEADGGMKVGYGRILEALDILDKDVQGTVDYLMGPKG